MTYGADKPEPTRAEGPRVTINASCFECRHCVSESYRVQSDSGSEVYCAHHDFEQRKLVDDTRWETPDWCPVVSLPDIRHRATHSGEGRSYGAGEGISRVVHENGPVVVDRMGEGLAWRPLDYGTWTPLATLTPQGDGEIERLREAFVPMEAWDERDETVLLLVDYSDGDHPLDDATVAITIGHNNDHNIGPDEADGWKFAGWCWSHDHYVEGKGTPIGWMPLPHHLAALQRDTGGDQ